MANERPASWRMPSPRQMEKLAREAARRPDREQPESSPDGPLPDELWDAVLADPRRRKAAAAGPAMLPFGNPASCAPSRMHALLPHCRNSEGRCGQILWAACRPEGCRPAAFRSDLHGPDRSA